MSAFRDRAMHQGRGPGVPRGWTFTRTADDPGLRALRTAGIKRGEAFRAARLERIARARRMHDDGLAVEAIAERLHVTARRVREYLAEPDVNCMLA